MKPVTIFGPGLIGGSLGLALRRRFPDLELRVCGHRESSLAAVRERDFADVVTMDPLAAARDAGTVVFCTPMDKMPALAAAIAPVLAPDAVVTDAGSVKASVVADLEPILGPRFVGAHPIAGSDRSGIAAARADLFDGARCVITPTELSDPAAVAAVTELWSTVGCVPIALSPADHDAALARTSHLPHLTAAALVNTLTTINPEWINLVGSGFRDSTRVAMGNADLWTGILLANRPAVGSSVAELIEILQNVRSLLDAGDEDGLREFLASAANARTATRASFHGI